MKRLLPLLMAACLLAGCTAAPVEPETPPEPSVQEASQQPVQTLSPVYADWTKLTAYETVEPLYTYHAAYGQPLQARNDYGPLLPYVGAIVDKLPLYGLVTAEGEIVTESIYANISWYGPFLVLYEGIRCDTSVESPSGIVYHGNFNHTIMAPDGSWMLDPDTRYNMRLFGSDQLLFTTEDGSVRLLNSDGAITAEIPRSAFEPYLGEDFQWTWEGGPDLMEDNGIMVVWWYNEESANDTHQYVAYLDLENGTVSDQPPEGWEPFDDSTYVPNDIQEPPELENYGHLTPTTDPDTGKAYYWGYNRTTGEEDLLDENGQVLFPGCGLDELHLYQTFLRAGLVSAAENNCFCYKEIETGETVFRYPVRSNSD